MCQSKPKVALVLSGGGAKGLAHIPLLKTLDSLQLKPDLIVGTSMGAVVGSLYAMGYSGDTIEHIAKNVDWNKILSNKIDMSAITTAEKDEFGKYAFELGLRDWKLDIPLGVIDGQELSMLLSRLCYPASNIENFDDLSIPFRCIATDLVNGKPVIFEEGNLATAIRASMAIPTVFTPVDADTTLLVDGGVFNNFPVDVAQSMDMDIIIGSDVSGGLSSIEELKSSLLSMVFQTAMMPSLTINAENQDNTSILLDHVPNLTYSTADFNASHEIIKQGEVALAAQLMAIDSLSKTLGARGFANEPGNFTKDSIKITDIEIYGADEKLQRLLTRKLAFSPNTYHNLNQVEEKIRYAFGTRFFSKLNYELKGLPSESTLKLNVVEKHKLNFNTAFHYDTQRGAGIVFNLTARNLLGTGSRMLASVDAAENPGARFQIQSYLGNEQKWWTRGELFIENELQTFYLNGRQQDDFKYSYGKMSLQINRDLSINDYMGAGVRVENNIAAPKIKPELRNINPDSLTLELNKFKSVNFGTFTRYHLNTRNRRYFPTRGSFMYIEGLWNITNSIKADFYSTQLPEVDEKIKSNIKFEFDYEQIYPLSSSLQGFTKFFVGHNFQLNNDPSDYDFFNYGILQYFFLGGLQQRAANHFIPFPGLKVGEIPASQILSASGGFQWSFLPSLYLIPTANVAVVGQSTFEDFYTNIFEFDIQSSEESPLLNAEWLYSISANFAYMSFLGPIQVEMATVNFERLEFYFSFGYIFQ